MRPCASSPAQTQNQWSCLSSRQEPVPETVCYALWGPRVCPRDRGARWAGPREADSALWCPLVPAGGILHRVAALLCAYHLPGQGPHAPRSHQRPGVHVHTQGRDWREEDLPSSRMGGKGETREGGWDPIRLGGGAVWITCGSGSPPQPGWPQALFILGALASGPPLSTSHPPGSLWTR